jgi:FAD:protein FMN transferase
MEAAMEAAFAAIGAVHRLMSFHDEGSDVSRLNRGAYEAAIRVHPWTFEVLEIALDLHSRSNGIFDIRIAPALQKLGLLPYHGGDLAGEAPRISGHGGIELLAGQRVRFRDRATQIDLGGIAKGFAVDRAIDVASSGAGFDPLHSLNAVRPPIIDPISGEPAFAVIGVTERALFCILADALMKIVMIGAEASAPILQQFGASALFVAADGDVRISSEWQDAAVLAA